MGILDDITKNTDEILSVLKECLNNEMIKKDLLLSNRIRVLHSKLSSDPFNYVSTIVRAYSMLDRIKTDLKNIKESPKKSDYHLSDLNSAITSLNRISTFGYQRQSSNYNSEDYYTNQIEELQKKEQTLNAALSEFKQQSAEHAEKEKELEDIKKQIKQSLAEKEELKKKLDASENLKQRISTAFDELKKHISPLKKEEKRLNRMFNSYAFLCAVVLGLLVYFEFSYLSKWEGAKNWIDYIPYYIPVPIVGGLLWAFIYQMNRAQRQLMQIANVLYHIDYVEGLLLAINLVSADINSASEKISHVLDNLIRNYMPTSDSLSEQAINTEISKDNINLKTFINLAKEIKDVIK